MSTMHRFVPYDFLPYDEFLGSVLQDVDLYADVDISRAAENHARQVHLLKKAIAALPAIAKAKGFGAAPSREAIGAAIDFARNLPSNRQLPRVAPDEDGDILMVWQCDPGGSAITFEGTRLHVVANPGHASTHFAPIIYDRGSIPPDILRCIPVRRD